MPFTDYVSSQQTTGTGGTFPGTSSSSTGTVSTAEGISRKLANLQVTLDREVGTPYPSGQGSPRQQGMKDDLGYSEFRPPTITTIGSAIDDLVNWDPSDVESLQRAMYAAGPGVFYSKAYYTRTNRTPIALGEPMDAGTLRAYETLLRKAAVSKQTPIEILNGLLSKKDPNVNYDIDAQDQPQMKVTNPEDIRAIVQKAAGDVYGHGADQTTIDRIVAAYQAQETQAQQSAANGDTSVTQAPDPSVFATDQLRQADPVEAGANQMTIAHNWFSDLLESSAVRAARFSK